MFLDIFDSVGPLGEAILDRRREITVDGHQLWLISPDDLAVLKAFSDRERDFEDLVMLLRVRGESLDLDYVRDWAAKLDESIGSDEVTRRFERAVQTSSTDSGSSQSW